MADPHFAADLARYGPCCVAAPPDLAEARAYCRRLALGHYENFMVASWLLPRSLRPHFYALYAYCRWSDDLADEVDGSAESEGLLDWWEGELEACYQGHARHPVYVALRETIAEFALPRQPLDDLLRAFRQDQRVTHYETFAQLEEYCRYSAQPVGRLVLHLMGGADPENIRLSDAICTGLQLANFWQDVARDFHNGRVYLPRETRLAHGYTDEMLRHREFNGAFRAVLRQEVDRAQTYFEVGLPLVERAPEVLRVDVSLFAAGGLAVLDAIRRIDYNVWKTRPTISRAKQLRLFVRSWWRPTWLATQARSSQACRN